MATIVNRSNEEVDEIRSVLGLKPSRSIDPQEILSFLWSKRNRRDLLKCDQKALAAEFGCDYTKFHRVVNQLVDEGFLKVVAVGSRGQKTYKILEPAKTEERVFWSSQGKFIEVPNAAENQEQSIS